MTKLVIELQSDAMQRSTSVCDLLRKSLVVAKKLKIPEFERWVNSELNGYPTIDEIPKYREVSGAVKAWNPYHGWVPIQFDNSEIAEIYSQRKIGAAVGSMEVLVENNKETILQMPYSKEIEADMMRRMGLPLQPALCLGSNVISGILDAIRNTVLNWALELEDKGVLGEGMSFTEEEKLSASKMQNVTIGNFQGVFGDVRDSTVTQHLKMDVRKGDFESLEDYLRSLGVEKSDVDELNECLKEEPRIEAKDKFGEKVSSWIGKTVGKAASGGLAIGIGVAGSLLARAISLFYGFS